jgi:hypothetical protein
MKTYNVTFTGRQKNAIGIFYKISISIQAPKDATAEEIRLKLYDDYEHISNLKIKNL